MTSIAIFLSLAGGQNVNTTQAIEGVWVDDRQRHVFVGNGRVDWEYEGTYGTAMMDAVPDGSLLGKYYAETEIDPSVRTDVVKRASDTPQWWSFPNHLYPVKVERGVRPTGEARVTVLKAKANGDPWQIAFDVTVAGRNPVHRPLLRSIPFSSLSTAGRFADKDETVEIEDAEGRTGDVRGSLTYLGTRMSFHGKRIMGRAGFVLFDDSRLGSVGKGTIVWSPSSDRALALRDRNATQTDQVSFYFETLKGGTANGVHKVLRRL